MLNPNKQNQGENWANRILNQVCRITHEILCTSVFSSLLQIDPYFELSVFGLTVTHLWAGLLNSGVPFQSDPALMTPQHSISHGPSLPKCTPPNNKWLKNGIRELYFRFKSHWKTWPWLDRTAGSRNEDTPDLHNLNLHAEKLSPGSFSNVCPPLLTQLPFHSGSCNFRVWTPLTWHPTSEWQLVLFTNDSAIFSRRWRKNNWRVGPIFHTFSPIQSCPIHHLTFLTWLLSPTHIWQDKTHS